MTIIVNCTECGRQLRLPQETLGSTVRCPICKAVFTTRAVPGGGAEAVPVIDPAGPPASPLPPLQRPASDPPISLQLDDEPAAPPPLPQQDTYDIVMEALPADDRPRRRSTRDEYDDQPREPRRPRRRDDDGDEGDEGPAAPRRRRSSGAFVAFRLFVHNDPRERLAGAFDAEVGPDGVEMWRGRGRVLPVPVGAPVEHVGGSRLLMEVDGRQVELSVIDPEEQHDTLAQRLADFLGQKVDTVEPPRRTVGPVLWLALAPLAIPLLALAFGHSIAGVGGMIAWIVVALLLGGVCLPIVLRRQWSPGGRAAGVLGVTSLGLGTLLIAFAFDSGRPPPPLTDMAWRPFAPVESGYRVEMPGHPGNHRTRRYNFPGNVTQVHELELADYGTWFFVGYSQANGALGLGAADAVNQAARDLTGRNISALVRGEQTVTVGGHPGKEIHLRSNDDDIVARLVVAHGRLFIAMVVTNRLDPAGPEVRKFLDSLALDPSTGWPNAVAGGPDVKPPEKKDDELADGGKVVYSPEREVAWAGFARDGRGFAAATVDGRIVRFDAFGGVRGRGQASLDAGEALAGGAWSPDGRQVYLLTDRGALARCTADDLRVAAKHRSRLTAAPLGVAVSSDQSTLAAARGQGGVTLWDLKGPTDAATLRPPPGGLALSVAFSEDASLIAVGDSEGTARVYDVQRAERATLRGHQPRDAFGDFNDRRYAIPALAFSRDGRTLVTVGNDRTARVWDVVGQRQRRLVRHDAAVLAVAFHPAGRLFATGSSNGAVRLFEASTCDERSGAGRRSRSGGPLADNAIRHLSFSADGKQLLVGLKTRVELWELDRRYLVREEDRKPVPVLPKNLTRIEAGLEGFGTIGPMAVRADGALVAITGRDGKLGVYDAATLALKEGLVIGPMAALAVHPREALVACGVHSNIHVRDVERSATRTLHSNTWQGVRALAYSPDGKRLAVGHSGGAGTARSDLRLWDVESSAVILTATQPGTVSGVAFSPDGSGLVTASEGDNLIRVWEAATGRECARLKGHTQPTLCAAYSPDGRWIASGGKDRSARLWDAARGRQAFALTGHADSVTSVAFSPDGKTLATGSDDKTVRLWDVASGAWLHTIPHEGTITGVGFGARGESLLVRASDGSLSRWGLAAIDALKKRPAPVTPDLDKSAAPEAPDLQPAAPIVPHTALVIAPKERVALAFTRDRLVMRYSYPDFTLLGATWTGLLVCKAALDPARGLVYAAVSDLGKATLSPQGLWEGEGGLAVLDVKALLGGKDVPARLAPVATVELGVRVADLSLTPDGRWLTYLDAKGAVGRVDATKRQAAGTVAIKGVTVKALAAAPSGDRVYLAGQRVRPGQIRGVYVALDPATGQLDKEVESSTVAADAEVVADHALVAPLLGGGAQVVSLKTGAATAWRMFGSRVARVAPGGKRVYFFSRAGLRDVQAFDLPEKLPGQQPPVTARYEEAQAAYGSGEWVMAPDGQCLVAPTGRVLRLGTGAVRMPTAAGAGAPRAGGPMRELAPLGAGVGNRLAAVAYSPDGKWLLTSHSDRALTARRAATGEQVWSRPLDRGEATGLAVAPDSSRWAAVGWAGSGQVFALPNHNTTRFLPAGLPAGLDTIAFSGDGKRVLLTGARGLSSYKADLFDAAAPADSTVEAPGLTGVAAGGASPPAVGALDGVVRLFDLDGKKVKAELKGHKGEVRCVAYSPDGKYLASGGIDGQVRVWSSDGKLLHALDAHAHVVLCLAFAPDGKTLASGAADGSLKLWDAPAGKMKVGLPPHPGRPVYGLAFSPDGKVLAGGSGPEVTRWDVSGHVGDLLRPVVIDAPAPVQKAPEAVGRMLTFADAVVDVKGGRVFACSPTGTSIAQLAYPGFTPRGVSRVEPKTYRLALDPAGGKLYALRATRTLPGENGARGEDVELLVCLTKDLPGEGKRLATIKPTQRLKIEGTVSQLLLSPDAKALYYLDVKGKRIGHIDAASLKVEGFAELSAEPAAMALTPDGKLLYAVTSRGDAHQLEVFGAPSLRALRAHKLSLKADEVVATSDRLVWVAGAQGGNRVDALYDEADGLKELRRQTGDHALAVRLAPDGRGVFLVPRKSAPFDVTYFPLGADRRPGVGRALPVASTRSLAGGTAVVSPDGKHLLFPGGAFRLPDLGEPKK